MRVGWQTLEPLTGILTLRKRKVDTNRWHCLLCKTANGALWAVSQAMHIALTPLLHM